ncbi:hypothetical protein VUR80DRAFT_5612 [Thermomyces stellatus]
MAPPESLKGCPRPVSASRRGPSPGPDPRAGLAAERDSQAGPGEPTGKPRDELPASPSLQRYLSKPAAHELRALGLPASTSPLAPGAPGSRQASSAPSKQSTVFCHGPAPKPGETSALPHESLSAGPIERDTSISLSPSPPACPSSEDDAEKYHDLVGLGAALKKTRNARPGHRRVCRVARRRTGQQREKKER